MKEFPVYIGPHCWPFFATVARGRGDELLGTIIAPDGCYLDASQDYFHLAPTVGGTPSEAFSPSWAMHMAKRGLNGLQWRPASA